MVIGPSRPSKKALLMCAIHGNEKVSTSVGMLMIQALLDMVKGNSVLSHHLRVQECWKDSECSDSVYQTKALQLFQDCEIYFIPAASPDSYESNTRWVDGVNPNRYPLSPCLNFLSPLFPLFSLAPLLLLFFPSSFFGFIFGGQQVFFPFLFFV